MTNVTSEKSIKVFTGFGKIFSNFVHLQVLREPALELAPYFYM